jgi:hypothetical protein
MADTHQVVYARLALSRQEIADRIVSAFRNHHVEFLHSVRGLDWDEDFQEFTPNIDQELENIRQFPDAFSATRKWTCACFDFRFLQWAFELYLYKDGSHHSHMQNVALSFPHSLYKVATEDIDVATQWFMLLGDIGVALDRAMMICGPDVLITSYTDSQLVERFHRYLEKFERGTYSIHTVLCPDFLSAGAVREKLLAEGFFISPIKDDYQLITLLRHDKRVRFLDEKRH